MAGALAKLFEIVPHVCPNIFYMDQPTRPTKQKNDKRAANTNHNISIYILIDLREEWKRNNRVLLYTGTKRYKMPRYYDIDTILAEEELLTVKPKFSFAHLSHLDPDSHRAAQGRKRRREVDGTIKKGGIHHHLPEGTKIQMPLWLVDRWAMLNFVRVPAPPKHYRQGMKERLEADAVHMNLW